MHYSPITLPPAPPRTRFRPDTPAPLAERQRLRLERLVARFRRDDLEALVDNLIARLDLLDGDPDLEDDDPAGDSLDEHGEHPSDSGTDLLPEMPLYGVDQSRGPLNEDRAYRRWQTDERARGLSLSGLARLVRAA